MVTTSPKPFRSPRPEGFSFAITLRAALGPQVWCVKSFGEQAVDLGWHLLSFFTLALLPPPRRTAEMNFGLVIGRLEVAHLLSQFDRSIKVCACRFRLTSLPRLYRFFEDRLQWVR